MKKLIIIGAGQFGREVADWVLQIPEPSRKWHFAGFLDSRPHILNGFFENYSIIGSPFDYMPQENEVFVCAIGDPYEKEKFIATLKSKGALFQTIIHPSAVIGSHNRIGDGCIICPGAIITNNVTIENFVTVNVLSSIGHDARIGIYSTLSSHIDVTGGANIGANVFVGSNASILPKATVGDGAFIGAGSVVLKRVAPGEKVFGNPAKRIGWVKTDRI